MKKMAWMKQSHYYYPEEEEEKKILTQFHVINGFPAGWRAGGVNATVLNNQANIIRTIMMVMALFPRKKRTKGGDPKGEISPSLFFSVFGICSSVFFPLKKPEIVNSWFGCDGVSKSQ